MDVSNNVYHFADYREKRYLNIRIEAYRKVINGMDKVELLEEMVRVVDQRSAKGPEFFTNRENVLRGLILFEKLNKQAESEDLFVLTTNYVKYLKNCLTKLPNVVERKTDDAS